MTSDLTTVDHERWNGLIDLCLRDKPPTPFAVQRAAKKCRAVRGDKTAGATTPDGHCHAGSCFWRLLSDAAAFDGNDGALWALRQFAQACRTVLRSLPEPKPPPLVKPKHGKRKAYRPTGRRSWSRGAVQNARWMNRADLNN